MRRVLVCGMAAVFLLAGAAWPGRSHHVLILPNGNCAILAQAGNEKYPILPGVLFSNNPNVDADDAAGGLEGLPLNRRHPPTCWCTWGSDADGDIVVMGSAQDLRRDGQLRERMMLRGLGAASAALGRDHGPQRSRPRSGLRRINVIASAPRPASKPTMPTPRATLARLVASSSLLSPRQMRGSPRVAVGVAAAPPSSSATASTSRRGRRVGVLGADPAHDLAVGVALGDGNFERFPDGVLGHLEADAELLELPRSDPASGPGDRSQALGDRLFALLLDGLVEPLHLDRCFQPRPAGSLPRRHSRAAAR